MKFHFRDRFSQRDFLQDLPSVVFVKCQALHTGAVPWWRLCHSGKHVHVKGARSICWLEKQKDNNQQQEEGKGGEEAPLCWVLRLWKSFVSNNCMGTWLSFRGPGKLVLLKSVMWLHICSGTASAFALPLWSPAESHINSLVTRNERILKEVLYQGGLSGGKIGSEVTESQKDDERLTQSTFGLLRWKNRLYLGLTYSSVTWSTELCVCWSPLPAVKYQLYLKACFDLPSFFSIFYLK